MALVASRFEVYLVRLDPTEGREIRKTRPCLIISPNEMNHHIGTVIVAPMTTKGRPYPTRVPLKFRRKSGQLVKRLGSVDQPTAARVLTVLAEMFAV